MKTILEVICSISLAIILSSCTPGMSAGPDGVFMERLQFPRIFFQGWGVNFQCPPGKVSDCVGAAMRGGFTVNKTSSN